MKRQKAAAPHPKPRPTTRIGKRVVTTYVTPDAWKQLRQLSLDAEIPTQILMEEAINLLFQKHRLDRVA